MRAPGSLLTFWVSQPFYQEDEELRRVNEASDLCPSRLATQFCHIREGKGSEVELAFLTAPEFVFLGFKWVGCLDAVCQNPTMLPP